MKLCKVKKKPIITAQKSRVKEKTKYHDKTNYLMTFKSETSSNKNPKNKTLLNSKENSFKQNIFKKSQTKDENSSSYIKSLPSYIAKKNFFITPTKTEEETPDANKTNKNDESLSTFIQTRQKNESTMSPRINTKIMKKQRPLSCCQRKKYSKDETNTEKQSLSISQLMKGGVFVKKKASGGTKNSFYLSKSDSELKLQDGNNSCVYYAPGTVVSGGMILNPNNSVDYKINYYNNNFNIFHENNNTNNILIFNNNNSNLITNNTNIITNNQNNNIFNNNSNIITNNSNLINNNQNLITNNIFANNSNLVTNNHNLITNNNITNLITNNNITNLITNEDSNNLITAKSNINNINYTNCINNISNINSKNNYSNNHTNNNSYNSSKKQIQININKNINKVNNKVNNQNKVKKEAKIKVTQKVRKNITNNISNKNGPPKNKNKANNNKNINIYSNNDNYISNYNMNYNTNYNFHPNNGLSTNNTDRKMYNKTRSKETSQKKNNYDSKQNEKNEKIRNSINFMNSSIIKKNNEINLKPNNSINSIINKNLLKEINFEDFYLLNQKFGIIKNNLNLLSNSRYSSNKQILENINMSRMFTYDLYKFYLGCSFEGCPQNLFNVKSSKAYVHFYSVIFILCLGLIYVITHKIKMTKDYYEKILVLLNLQEKAFLLLCDLIIKNIDIYYSKDIWVSKMVMELKDKMVLNNTCNHIIQIKTISIDSYKIFNDMLFNIYIIDTEKIENKCNDPENFLYKHFHNKTINFLSQISMNELEEIFDKNIFKVINLRSNFANITSLKYSNNSNQNNNINNKYSNSHQNLPCVTEKKENINFHDLINEYEFNLKNILSNRRKNSQIRNNNTKNITVTNPKQFLKNFKIKEPYLDFPPRKEYTLVLDLDETMISFQFTDPCKSIGKMHLRPGLEHFLEVIKNYYEIIVFTSGTRDYANMVLDVLEHKKQTKFFDGRLYREHTTRIGNKYIKDLSKLGRDLSRTLIVDNLPQSFKFQHENGILISSFFGEESDRDDRALIELQKILIKIYEEKEDVRVAIIKYKEEIIRNVSCLDLRTYYDDDVFK